MFQKYWPHIEEFGSGALQVLGGAALLLTGIFLIWGWCGWLPLERGVLLMPYDVAGFAILMGCMGVATPVAMCLWEWLEKHNEDGRVRRNLEREMVELFELEVAREAIERAAAPDAAIENRTESGAVPTDTFQPEKEV